MHNGDEDKPAAAGQVGLLPADPPVGDPQEKQIPPLTAALLRGDFRQARRLARQLVSAGEVSETERAFAEQVLRRTDIDPVALGVGLASFLTFWVIVYLTVWH